ncbi:hypothetical protein [Bacteroides pyogenes]|uniref:hypothetical protein n=1 Tax=Bacteroides pyogenes TaxID=310300 RepID=UPI002A918AA1|nr:hypothetical protein [Bacteroides pyogenes]MDY5433688.1 hypothetical protein [Bacteroides pyogenes]
MQIKKELSPSSEIDCTTIIGDEYIPQVRTFGALGYTPHRICTLLGIRGKKKMALILRLSLPGDVYYDAYRNGCALGEYNIDAELAKKAETGDVNAIETLETRKQERIVKDLRQQLFGI